MKKVFIFALFALLGTMAFSQSTKINVMTFNIRLDTESDSLNSWKYRKENVAKTVLLNNVDILGTQEVLHNQLVDLENSLSDFTSIGVGRDDGEEKGEYSAIFYNTKKFKEDGSGYFWLSETPMMAGSKGWDAACIRIATWVRLKEISTGKIFFVLNTHFDHLGKVARIESAKLILEKIDLYTKKKKLPVILTGDFNAAPTSDVIKILTDKSNSQSLTDSRLISPVVNGPEWSFHNFGKLPLKQRELIDYVFVKNNVKVLSYEMIDGTKTSKFSSDHNALLVKVEL